MADQTINVFINLNSNLEARLGKTTRAVDDFSRRADPAIRRMNKSFLGLGRGIGGVANKVGQLTKRWLSLGAAVATTAVIFKSITDAQRFGIAIAEIGTIFDGTDQQLRGIEQTILDLSEALGLPEVIAAKGFYQIISSDITDAAEAMVVLKEGTELATVGLADVKQTIDVLTSVIKAYQADVDTAARISEVLFKTVVKGKTTIPELATSLGQVLPIAAQLGINLEEVSASVATLTQGGIDTNVAIIQLRQAFNSLLKPSAEAAAILAKYNINVSAARVRTTGFRDVLEELRDKIGDNTADLSKIFGNIRALIPVLALTGKQAEQFGKNLRFIGQESDLADEALQKFLDNPFKRFQRFFNTLRIRLRAVGEVFIKELSNQLEASGFDRAINNIDTLFSGLKGAAEIAGEAVGSVINQISGFIENLGGIERAQELLLALGKTVGGAVNVVFQTAVAILTTFSEVLARLPAIVASVANEVRSTFGGKFLGKLTGIASAEPFKDEIQARIDAVEEYKEVIDKARALLAIPPDISSRKGEREGLADEVRRELGRFVNAERRPVREALEGRDDDALKGLFDQARGDLRRLKQELADAPERLATVANSFGPFIENLGETQKAAAGVGDAWGEALSALQRPLPEKSADDLEASLGRLLETLGRLGAGGLLNSLGSDLSKTTIDLDNLTASALRGQLVNFAKENQIDVEVGVSFLPEVERLGALGRLVDAFDGQSAEASLMLEGVDEAVSGLESVTGFLDELEKEIVEVPFSIEEDAALQALELIDEALSRVDGRSALVPVDADTDEARRGLADLGGLLENLRDAEGLAVSFDLTELEPLDELLKSFDGELIEIPFDVDLEGVTAGLEKATELLTSIVDLAGDIPFEIDVAAARSAVFEVGELLESVGTTAVDVPLNLDTSFAEADVLALQDAIEELRNEGVELPSLRELETVLDVLSGQEVKIPVGLDNDAALRQLSAVVKEIDGLDPSIDIPFEVDIDAVRESMGLVSAVVRENLGVLRSLFDEIESGEIKIPADVDIRAGIEALDDLVRVASSRASDITALDVPFDLDVDAARSAVGELLELLGVLSEEAVEVPVGIDTTEARDGIDAVDALLEQVRGGVVDLPVGVNIEQAEAAIASVRARLDDLDAGATDLTLDLTLDTSETTEDINRTSELIKKTIEDTFGVVLPQLGSLDTEGLEDAFDKIIELSELELGLLSDIPDKLREQVGVLAQTQGLREAEFKSQILTLGADEQRRKKLVEIFRLFQVSQRQALTGFTSQQDALDKINRGLSVSIERQRESLRIARDTAVDQATLDLELGDIDTEQFDERIVAINRTIDDFQAKLQEKILTQPAFELTGPVSDAFRGIEIRAKAAAIEAAEIPGGIASTTEEVERLRAEFNKFFREETSDFDAFITGFSKGIAQIGDELGDTFTRGIEAATSAVDGFRSSFQSALSDLIAGTASGSEALEAFRESFALSLADSLSTALTDTVTSGILNILPGVGEEATEGAEALAAFTPAVAAIEKAALSSEIALGGAATLLDTAGGVLLAAGQAWLAAIVAQEGEGIAKIISSAVTAGFTGGATSSEGGPAPDNETFGLGGFSDRRGGFERLAAGGVKTTRTFAEIAEAGVPELVVPLPGNNRRVPVELKNPSAIVGGRGGGGDRFIVQASVGLTFNNLDPRGAQQAVLSQMPGIMKGISASLENGSNRELSLAVRKTARGS